LSPLCWSGGSDEAVMLSRWTVPKSNFGLCTEDHGSRTRAGKMTCSVEMSFDDYRDRSNANHPSRCHGILQ